MNSIIKDYIKDTLYISRNLSGTYLLNYVLIWEEMSHSDNFFPYSTKLKIKLYKILQQVIAKFTVTYYIVSNHSVKL